MHTNAINNIFRPCPSLIKWSKEGLENSIRLQDYNRRFPLAYISCARAVICVAALPITFLLDPIIGIWETIQHTNHWDRPRVIENFKAKLITSPMTHIKIALKAVGIHALAVPLFYGFSIISAFTFNLCFCIPVIGQPLGCLSVSWLMHVPCGWYAIMVNAAFN